MKFEILHIEDTPDGGAIITIEADRNLLHYAFEKFINDAIMEKVNETIFEDLCAKDHAREMAEKDGSAPNSDSESKTPVGFCDADECSEQQFWADKSESIGRYEIIWQQDVKFR
jgi:hypothetical protein